jgi:hypothetical protein
MFAVYHVSLFFWGSHAPVFPYATCNLLLMMMALTTRLKPELAAKRSD